MSVPQATAIYSLVQAGFTLPDAPGIGCCRLQWGHPGAPGLGPIARPGDPAGARSQRWVGKDALRALFGASLVRPG